MMMVTKQQSKATKIAITTSLIHFRRRSCCHYSSFIHDDYPNIPTTLSSLMIGPKNKTNDNILIQRRLLSSSYSLSSSDYTTAISIHNIFHVNNKGQQLLSNTNNINRFIMPSSLLSSITSEKSSSSQQQSCKRMYHSSTSVLLSTTTSSKDDDTINNKEKSSIDNDNNNGPIVLLKKVKSKNGGIIAHVILNRPKKHNALNMNMFIAIRQIILDIKHDKTIRVVILSGNGKSFCTGLDVASMFDIQNIKQSTQNVKTLLQRPYNNNDNNNQEYHNPVNSNNDISSNSCNNDHELYEKMKISNLAQDVSYLWRILDVPVICAIHGMCYGGGYQIALGCDIRLACSNTAKFSIMESKWGLIPDMGITIILRELKISMDIIKELTMTGRIISSKHAYQYGFITHLIDTPSDDDSLSSNEHVVNAAIILANEIIERSPDSVALCKHLYQNTYKQQQKKQQQQQQIDINDNINDIDIDVSEEYCLHLETQYQKNLLFSYNQFVTILRSRLNWKFLPYIYRKVNT